MFTLTEHSVFLINTVLLSVLLSSCLQQPTAVHLNYQAGDTSQRPLP